MDRSRTRRAWAWWAPGSSGLRCYHLSRAGARVTLFDKAQPGSGATQNSFAWLNAFAANPDYRALRLQSMQAYQIWTGASGWVSSGGLCQLGAYPAGGALPRESAAQMDGRPYAVRRIDAAQLHAMTPSLTPGTVAEAFFSRIDGHLDPLEATRRFVEAARRHGTVVKLQCDVQGLDVTHEIMGGSGIEALAPFRPERFAARTAADRNFKRPSSPRLPTRVGTSRLKCPVPS